MGAGNVKLVFACWGELAHAPFRALAYMALVSKDDDRPPRYWAGREGLALALGRIVPPRNDRDPDATRERRAAFRAVDRAVAELTKAGAIETTEEARHYRNATYALHLSRGSTTVSVVQQDHGERGAKNHGERGVRTTVSVTKNHGERGPQEYKEEGGLTSGGESWGGLPSEGGAHARARPSLETVPTNGVRDAMPAAPGVPGQRAMLLPVADRPTMKIHGPRVPSRRGVDEDEPVPGTGPPPARCADCGGPMVPRPGRDRCGGCMRAQRLAQP